MNLSISAPAWISCFEAARDAVKLRLRHHGLLDDQLPAKKLTDAWLWDTGYRLQASEMMAPEKRWLIFFLLDCMMKLLLPSLSLITAHEHSRLFSRLLDATNCLTVDMQCHVSMLDFKKRHDISLQDISCLLSAQQPSETGKKYGTTANAQS